MQKQIEEPERISISEPGQNLLSCPFATDLGNEHETRGNYPDDYPMGAVIHYTAGEGSGMGTVNQGKRDGLAYWVIDRGGEIFQTHRLDRWGYHAGRSYYGGLGKSVSKRLLGIELISAGKLTQAGPGKFLTWYGKSILQTNVRMVESRDNIIGGAYHKITNEQCDALITLLIWLKNNNPEVFSFEYVIGHDEAARGRKTDPGGVIPWAMPELREHLTEWNK